MNPLFYVAAALSLGAIAVTIHAFLSAPEAYEDEEGFHVIHRNPARTHRVRARDGHGAPKVHPHFLPR
jgi:hypothetical protein